jgi:hypothetical protein
MRGINWIFAIALVSFHLGALAALFYFRWSTLVVFLMVWILAQNVGIAMGYHRMLTHRGYSTPKWLEFQTDDSHSLDPVLRLLALSPIRCVNCWRRFYWFGKRRSDKT